MLDLPFGWDDGNFISPFVATSTDDMLCMAQWMRSEFLTVCSAGHCCCGGGQDGAESTTASAAASVGLVYQLKVVDLGCGDGNAVMSFGNFICKEWQQLEEAKSPGVTAAPHRQLQVDITGIDLDRDLVTQAEAAWAAVGLSAVLPAAPSPTASMTARFICTDIRDCDAGAYFPPSGGQDGGSPHLPSILYMYLLPEALRVIHDTIQTALSRGWIVASNRWPIDGLADCIIGKAGNVYLYRKR